MKKPRLIFIFVFFLTLTLVASSCDKDDVLLPNNGQNEGTPTDSHQPGDNYRCTNDTILPVNAKTVRYMPEMQLWDAPVGSDIQSSYFRTTETNRTIKRGFFEYEIPDCTCKNKLVSAKLIFGERGGWTSVPMPTDNHTLSYFYGGLSSDKIDFEREVTDIFCFTTDPNDEESKSWNVDITIYVKNSEGKITFRVSLKDDFDITISDGWAGTDFMRPELVLVY